MPDKFGDFQIGGESTDEVGSRWSVNLNLTGLAKGLDISEKPTYKYG